MNKIAKGIADNLDAQAHYLAEQIDEHPEYKVRNEAALNALRK